MKPVELSVVINRPIEPCFAYLADLENDLEWRREWIDAEQTTDAISVGARFRLTGALLGRRIATVYEAIAYEPTRLAAWKAVSGPSPLTLRSGDASSRRPCRSTSERIRVFGRRQLEGDFPKLKQLLEGAA